MIKSLYQWEDPVSTRTTIALGDLEVRFLVEADDTHGAATVFECLAYTTPPRGGVDIDDGRIQARGDIGEADRAGRADGYERSRR